MATVPTLQMAADLTQSQAAGSASSLVPTGSILTYAGSSAPAGWLVCDGASLSTTTYASLFATIGYTFGGSGASFNLPDLRGRFVRYDDNMGAQGISGVSSTGAAGRDTSRAHGSAQGDTTKRPTTAFTTASQTVTGSLSTTATSASGSNNIGAALGIPGTYPVGSGGGVGINDNQSKTITVSVPSVSVTGTLTAPASTVNGGGDAETRPVNIALNAIIKI